MELSSILIVDDDAASLARLARLVAELLDPQPVRLRTAANLADARDLLQRESFALALVDMQLPDGTGTDLIAWMQQQATQAQAVIVSAFAEEEAIFAAIIFRLAATSSARASLTPPAIWASTARVPRTPNSSTGWRPSSCKTAGP